MPTIQDILALSDEALLAQCDRHTYKSSGPGGQHRNKTLSAVRLLHRPTGILAHGDDSRSQHQNRQLALRRLRMNIACRLRTAIDPAGPLPPVVAGCAFTARGGPAKGTRRMEIGPRDERFWPVAAFLLDLLDACGGRLSDAASILGISTGNLSALLTSERHLLAAAQEVRKKHGLSALCS